jgi:hypothetical protein
MTFLDFDNDKDEGNTVLQQYQQILSRLNVQEYGYQLQLGPIHMGVACTFNNKWNFLFISFRTHANVWHK